MDYVCARLNARNHRECRKILTSTQHIFSETTLAEITAIPYRWDTLLGDGEFFFTEHAREQEYRIDLMQGELLTEDYNTLKAAEIAELDYLFVFCEDSSLVYFQSVTKSSRIEKKGLVSVGGEFTFRDDMKLIVIRDEPDAIYDRESDRLYFRRLESLTRIFKGIDQLYKEATGPETEAFLHSDFISLKDGFTADQVKTANRKRIAMASEILSHLHEEERRNLVQYIGKYCPNLKVDDNMFGIGSEQELKSLLYGIDQRYYTTEIGQERRLANSVISID